jgi:hypothetical protein
MQLLETYVGPLRYVFLHILRLLLEKDKVGEDIIRCPEKYVRDDASRKRLTKCMQNIIDDMVGDVNDEVGHLGEDFDYRGKLRDAEWVKGLASDTVGTHMKLVRRGKIQCLADEWAKASS